MLPLTDRKILIVDDEVELRELFAAEFSYSGATVSTAKNGLDALESIRKGHFDIVFSDIKMPNLDGIDLIKKIKAENLDVKVCVLISGFSEHTVQDAYDAGASSLFSKPSDFDYILGELQRLIQPIADRLKAKRFPISDALETQINVTKYPLEKEARIINISHGGMFVAADSYLPRINEKVKFSVSFTGADINFSNFTGFGICRWIRGKSDSNGPMGYGLEFIELSDDSIVFLKDLIQKFKSTAFIPKS